MKYLDRLEQYWADEAALEGRKYTYILHKPYRSWSWAAHKDEDGKLDHNTATTGGVLSSKHNQVNASLTGQHNMLPLAANDMAIRWIFTQDKNKILRKKSQNNIDTV